MMKDRRTAKEENIILAYELIVIFLLMATHPIKTILEIILKPFLPPLAKAKRKLFRIIRK